MAHHALAVIQALGLSQIDLLGFSIGGFVAQQVTLDRPDLVRRVILVGTAPQGGEGFAKFSPEVQAVAALDQSKPEDLLFLFFAPTQTSQAAGRAFLGRLGARKEDREPPSTIQVRDAQLTAIHAWGTPQGERYARLREITHPVLVVNGNQDSMIPTINAYILEQHLPNAQLILYPDAGHGSLFQYPAVFVEHASLFLRG